MFGEIVTLKKTEHSKLRLKPSTSVEHIRNQHLIPLVVHEFPFIALNFPIIFAKNPSTNQFNAAVLLGFEEYENILVSDNSWAAVYIPESSRCYPFKIQGESYTDSNAVIGFYQDSPNLSYTEGDLLFDDEGEATEVLQKITQFLTQHAEKNVITQKFVQYLTDNDLFKESNIVINKEDGSRHKVAGIYCVDEDKIKNLPNEKFIELKEKGYLPPIYTHLFSMGQINRLLEIKHRNKHAASS